MPGTNYNRQFKLDCVRQVATGQKRPAQLCREHGLAQSVFWCAGEERRLAGKQPSSREEALKARIAELESFCGKLAL